MSIDTDQMVSDAMSADDELQAAAHGLAKLAMAEAARVFIHGTPRDKAALLVKFMPYIARSLNAEENDSRMDDLRAEFEKMRNEMMSVGPEIPLTAPGADDETDSEANLETDLDDDDEDGDWDEDDNYDHDDMHDPNDAVTAALTFTDPSVSP